MEEERLKAILESLLFAAGTPISLMRLGAVLNNVPRDTIKRALNEMALAFASSGRGIVLEQVAGGYQLRTPKEHAFYVRKLLASKPPRLTRPLLETLAIIAYKQPLTRAEIEQLRGVDCGGVLETLLERRLVKIAGRKEVPGRPLIYATAQEFLELFGLKDLDSLPDLSEFREVEEAIDAAGERQAEEAEAQRSLSYESQEAPREESEPPTESGGESEVREESEGAPGPAPSGEPHHEAAPAQTEKAESENEHSDHDTEENG